MSTENEGDGVPIRMMIATQVEKYAEGAVPGKDKPYEVTNHIHNVTPEEAMQLFGLTREQVDQMVKAQLAEQAAVNKPAD